MMRSFLRLPPWVGVMSFKKYIFILFVGWVGSPPVNAEDSGDLGSIPGSGSSPWRRAWQPSPVFLPGKSRGQRSLAGYSPWGHKESDMTKLNESARDGFCHTLTCIGHRHTCVPFLLNPASHLPPYPFQVFTEHQLWVLCIRHQTSPGYFRRGPRRELLWVWGSSNHLGQLICGP